MKLRLTVDVEYDANGVSEDELKERLSMMVQNSAGDGAFTGDTPATTYEWTAEVERIPGTRWWFVPTGDFEQDAVELAATTREAALEEALGFSVSPGYVTDESPLQPDSDEDPDEPPTQ